MGYVVEGRSAVDDTREAWRIGVGWHTATNRYVELPDWFESYFGALKP